MAVTVSVRILADRIGGFHRDIERSGRPCEIEREIRDGFYPFHRRFERGTVPLLVGDRDGKRNFAYGFGFEPKFISAVTLVERQFGRRNIRAVMPLKERQALTAQMALYRPVYPGCVTVKVT